jgi:hypothetical protein
MLLGDRDPPSPLELACLRFVGPASPPVLERFLALRGSAKDAPRHSGQNQASAPSGTASTCTQLKWNHSTVHCGLSQAIIWESKPRPQIQKLSPSSGGVLDC